MDLSVIYQILSLGVTGFAFVMLFLGYNLIRKYPGRENHGNVRFFLVISLVFFVIGALINLFEDRRPKELRILVIPSRCSSDGIMPEIRNTTADEKMAVSETGEMRTQVYKNTALVVNFTDLEKRLSELERIISGYQQVQSDGSGIGVAHD